MGKSSPLNAIFSWIIKKRLHQIELFKKHPFEVQQELLFQLVAQASSTEFGKQFMFSSISSIKAFQENVPLQYYQDVVPYIERLKKGEQNLLWASTIKWFAKSSGTTGQKSKFIPVSKESLFGCHYKGGKDLLALYYFNNPKTQLFKGKHLIVGGSTSINYLNPQSYFGDLSAIIVKNLPWWCEWRRTPSKETTLMNEWEEKMEKMAKETIHDDVHIIAGVPSWTLILLQKIVDQQKVKSIFDVWPNLELYMHGGVNFEPYRKQFERLITKKDFNYLQTYNATEGFFGIQDKPVADDMLLMLDYGIFYEFIPLAVFNENKPPVYTLKDTRLDEPYVLVISTNSGLWRYVIGDVIIFTDTNPYRFKIIGRTTQYINAFGEELVIANAEEAINEACQSTGAIVQEYTACPIFISEETTGRHEWLIEFDTLPGSLSDFTLHLDVALKNRNGDYEAKRSQNIVLQAPLVTPLKNGTFYAWLKQKGKLGGQHKIPRLYNDRSYADEILEIQL